MSTVEIPSSADLNAMSRTELDALASDLGLDPADYTNKGLIVNAIENERQGDTPEAQAAVPEEEAVYPAYMGITPGERDDPDAELDEPVSGITVIPFHGRDPEDDLQQGDLIVVNTDSDDPSAVVRVIVETDEDEPRPVFQMTVPGFPMRTPQFNLGPGPLWDEHTNFGGNAVFTLVTSDEEGNETERGSVGAIVRGEEMPEAEVAETPEIQTPEMLDPHEEEE